MLGERIRAVVIADYEKTSAVTAEVGHLLDEEAGGAIAAFRALLGDPETDRLDPVLVTGSTVLVDDDLAAAVHATRPDSGSQRERLDVELDVQPRRTAFTCSPVGATPGVRGSTCAMITELFQRGRDASAWWARAGCWAKAGTPTRSTCWST